MRIKGSLKRLASFPCLVSISLRQGCFGPTNLSDAVTNLIRFAR